MKYREFVYVGDAVSELNEQEHAALLMNIQKSIVLSRFERERAVFHNRCGSQHALSGKPERNDIPTRGVRQYA
ncbi:MAG: hypothetical protein Q4C50_06560 [Eubacteriales bacterium]|nr:hypothetical protein [Eubacteriales bacterium]